MLQYIKLWPALSALHIFYEILHTRIRQGLTMATLFKRNRLIRFVVYFTGHNFWLTHFGCTNVFPQTNCVNTKSLDYPEITHTVYQHQQLKWAALLRIRGRWPYRQDTASALYRPMMTSWHGNAVHITDPLNPPIGSTHKDPEMQSFLIVFVVSPNSWWDVMIQNVCTHGIQRGILW